MLDLKDQQFAVLQGRDGEHASALPRLDEDGAAPSNQPAPLVQTDEEAAFKAALIVDQLRRFPQGRAKNLAQQFGAEAASRRLDDEGTASLDPIQDSHVPLVASLPADQNMPVRQ